MKNWIYLAPILALANPAWATSSVENHQVATAGSACQPISGTPTYSGFGHIRNESTTTPLVVDCPLGYHATAFNSNNEIEITAVLKGNGTTLSCTFSMEEPWTGNGSDAFMSSSASGKFAWNAIFVDTFSAVSLAPLHVMCTLPPKVGSIAATIYGFETWPN